MKYSLKNIKEQDIIHYVKTMDYYCALFDIWNALYGDYDNAEQLKDKISLIFDNNNVDFNNER